VLSFAWGGVVKMLAAGLGVEVSELREIHERRPATQKIDLGFGVIEEGTTAALRFEVQGIVAGSPRIVVEHVTRLDDDLCPDWPQPVGAGGYRVVVTGTPSYQCDVQMTARTGEGDPGVVGTAGRIVNAIPFVCDAPSGLLSALDVPLVTGRGVMR
jgi:4-hydroxy-tetrahydrodipicolinate reductase